MAREKNVTRTAATANYNLRALLEYQPKNSSGSLQCTVFIEHDQGPHDDVVTFAIADALTGSIGAGTQQSRFNQLMIVLRDFGFNLEGYNEV